MGMGWQVAWKGSNETGHLAVKMIIVDFGIDFLPLLIYPLQPYSREESLAIDFYAYEIKNIDPNSSAIADTNTMPNPNARPVNSTVGH